MASAFYLFTCWSYLVEEIEFGIFNETSDWGEGSTLDIVPRMPLNDCSVVECPKNHNCKIFQG